MLMETELLQASRAGDRSAFERIVEQYQAAVCAITFSGTGRIDVSEELAQETFVNAWQNLHQLRDLSGFRAWLYSIARHALHNYHRRRQPVSLDACPEEATTDDTHNPPEILMREEEHVLLEQAILRLPAQYREPLVMFHRQQQSIRDSAEALGLSEATFRTRLHRARNLLREDLAQRVEHALGRTGPRKGFTKAVMVAIGGLPVGQDETTLDVQLANPRRLSGRVVDDQGQPVAEAVIGMDSYQGKSVWGLTEFSYSDAEGRFIVPNAPSMSEYRLLVLGDDILRANCTVDPNLEECLITASRSGRIYGRVVDAQSGRCGRRGRGAAGQR